MPSDSRPPKPPNLASLRDARERAIAQLSEAFAHDEIGVDEFERRLTLAHRAEDVTAVNATLRDLSALSDLAVSQAPAEAIVPAPSPAMTPGFVRDTDRVLAIFGGVERHGAWTLPRHLQASAIMGGLLLDLREAALLPGVSEIHITAIMGGAQIIVPPNLAVEVSGTAIMGGFAHVERGPVQRDPEQRVLRVHGIAIMGGVAVETRLPGETEMDAHRRRAQDLRALGPGQEPKRLPQRGSR
ncbi:MAG TPA: LiaF domain-containing protein [Gemmatimonadaceae bacterium]|nr:LiaF domain-containing protein [Gemmatimonadaceae bacterium]